MARLRVGWVGCLLFAALIVSPVGAATRSKRSSAEPNFDSIDAEVLMAQKPTARGQKLYEWEPYSEEADSHVLPDGMPPPLDDDLTIHTRYEKWLQEYKRKPNVKVPPWSYVGDPDTWPEMWSTLRPSFAQCDPDTTSRTSSPIDIPTKRAEDQCYGPSYPLKTPPEWSDTPATPSEYVDRSIILDVENCKQKCKICNVDCGETPVIAATIEHPDVSIDRVIVKTPSEHKLDGETLGMELQFMHKAASYGGPNIIPPQPLLGIAVLFEDMGANFRESPEWLMQLARNISGIGTNPSYPVPGLTFAELTEQIKPILGDYYMYYGSQTYPPCYQAVQWMIPTTTLKVSSAVIEAFKGLQGENVRPSFALGNRPLVKFRPETESHWTYRGPRGVSWWGSTLEYTSCGKTADCELQPNQVLRDKCLAEQQRQSPIDIYTNECMPNVNVEPCVTQAGMRPIGFDVASTQPQSDPLKIYIQDCDCYPCTNVNNAYTLAIKVPEGPFLPYQGSDFALSQITFHTPSEHAFDGVTYAMEVQFHMDRVRGDGDRKKLKIAILFETGEASPDWVHKVAMVADDANGTPDSLVPDFHFRDISVAIHPLLDKYFFYEGSETRPPCSGDGVTWLVLKTVFKVTEEDLVLLQAAQVGDNVRPIQPLNGRLLSVAGTAQFDGSAWGSDGQ